MRRAHARPRLSRRTTPLQERVKALCEQLQLFPGDAYDRLLEQGRTRQLPRPTQQLENLSPVNRWLGRTCRLRLQNVPLEELSVFMALSYAAFGKNDNTWALHTLAAMHMRSHRARFAAASGLGADADFDCVLENLLRPQNSLLVLTAVAEALELSLVIVTLNLESNVISVAPGPGPENSARRIALLCVEDVPGKPPGARFYDAIFPNARPQALAAQSSTTSLSPDLEMELKYMGQTYALSQLLGDGVLLDDGARLKAERCGSKNDSKYVPFVRHRNGSIERLESHALQARGKRRKVERAPPAITAPEPLEPVAFIRPKQTAEPDSNDASVDGPPLAAHVATVQRSPVQPAPAPGDSERTMAGSAPNAGPAAVAVELAAKLKGLLAEHMPRRGRKGALDDDDATPHARVLSDAKEALRRINNKLLRELKFSCAATMVGAESAGKSTVINSIIRKAVVHVDDQKPLPAGAEALPGCRFSMVITPLEPDDVPENDDWFSDGAQERADVRLANSRSNFDPEERDVLPTGGDDKTTAVCTEVFLSPTERAPRLVLLYKSAAYLARLRSQVESVHDFDWEAWWSSAGGETGEDSDGEDAIAGRADSRATAGRPPMDVERIVDEAVAVFGVDMREASYEAGDSALSMVRMLTAEDQALPPRMRSMLGARVELFFHDTKPEELLSAARDALLQFTVGAWSHWGLLEEPPALYLRGNQRLLLRDVPGYPNTDEQLPPHRLKMQQIAFESRPFSTLLHVVSSKADSMPSWMVNDQGLGTHVFSAMTAKAGDLDFGVVPLFAADYATAAAKGKKTLKNLPVLIAGMHEQVKKGVGFCHLNWNRGLKKYMSQPGQSHRGSHAAQLPERLQPVLDSGVIRPLAVQINPHFFDEAIEEYRKQNRRDPPAEQRGDNAAWDVLRVLDVLSENAARYEKRAAGRAVDALLSAVLLPLARHGLQLLGLRHVQVVMPQLLEQLQQKFAPSRLNGYIKSVDELVRQEFEKNDMPHIREFIKSVTATSGLLLKEARRENVENRFEREEFERYNRPNSHKLRMDLLLEQPQNPPSLLVDLLFGTNTVTQLTAAIAAAGNEHLPRVLDKGMARGAGVPSPAAPLPRERSRGAVNSTVDTVVQLMNGLLDSNLHAVNDAAAMLARVTKAAFRVNMLNAAAELRERVLRLTSGAALSGLLAGNNGVLSVCVGRVGADMSGRKFNSNRLRMKSLATRSENAARDVDVDLRTALMSLLQTQTASFTEAAVQACSTVLVKLTSPNGLASLAVTGELRKVDRLMKALCTLSEELLRPGASFELDAEQTKGMRDAVEAYASMRAGKPQPAGAMPPPSPPPPPPAGKPAPSHEELLRVRARARGLELVPTPLDGNCFLHATFAGPSPDDADCAAWLLAQRQQVVATMRSGDVELPDDSVFAEGLFASSPDNWAEQLVTKDPPMWFDHLSIHLWAVANGRRLTILRPEGPEYDISLGPGDGEELIVGHLPEVHYVGFRPLGAPPATAAARIAAAAALGGGAAVPGAAAAAAAAPAAADVVQYVMADGTILQIDAAVHHEVLRKVETWSVNFMTQNRFADITEANRRNKRDELMRAALRARGIQLPALGTGHGQILGDGKGK